MLTIENTDTVEYNGLSDGTANKKLILLWFVMKVRFYDRITMSEPSYINIVGAIR